MAMARIRVTAADRLERAARPAGAEDRQAPDVEGGIRGLPNRFSRPMRRLFKTSGLAMGMMAALLILVTACDEASTTDTEPGSRPDLPEIGAEEFEAHLETIGRPAVVNVWASWCLPCRSEAPLLNEAFAEYGDRIEFIGVDVQDNQADAKAFLAEFGLDFDHFFDPNREIPARHGGIGTPITFFFAPDGELVTTHNGVIDERALALNIDELLARS